MYKYVQLSVDKPNEPKRSCQRHLHVSYIFPVQRSHSQSKKAKPFRHEYHRPHTRQPQCKVLVKKALIILVISRDKAARNFSGGTN